MNNFSVYVHITPSNKLYIGVTSTDPIKRWGSGGVRYKSNFYFWNAIKKYGWDNIKHIILLSDLSKDVAYECERYLISKYNTRNKLYGYNHSAGGEKSAYGNHLSSEAREKIRQFQLGRPKSEETKQKLRLAHLGKPKKPFSDEHRRKISENNKGRVMSEESRRKLSESRKGIKFSDEHRKKLSDAKKGKPGHKMSDSNKEKLRAINTTRKRTDEELNRLRSYSIGRIVSDETRKKMSESQLKRWENIKNGHET